MALKFDGLRWNETIYKGERAFKVVGLNTVKWEVTLRPVDGGDEQVVSGDKLGPFRRTPPRVARPASRTA